MVHLDNSSKLSLPTELLDLMDLLSYTTSSNFIEKWRFKFSEKFIKYFQLRLIKALKDRKPLKKDTLYLFLKKKCGYSKEQVLEFFDSIDIEIYNPVIRGKLTKHLDN